MRENEMQKQNDPKKKRKKKKKKTVRQRMPSIEQGRDVQIFGCKRVHCMHDDYDGFTEAVSIFGIAQGRVFINNLIYIAFYICIETKFYIIFILILMEYLCRGDQRMAQAYNIVWSYLFLQDYELLWVSYGWLSLFPGV